MDHTPWNIEWSDALSMDNSEVDAEHQHFIRLVNELNEAISDQRRDRANVERIMALILEDALTHFAHEELLFNETAYPGAQAHAQRHMELIGIFQQAMKDIHHTESSRRWVEIGLSIKDLLVEHVVSEDTQYISYLRNSSNDTAPKGN